LVPLFFIGCQANPDLPALIAGKRWNSVDILLVYPSLCMNTLKNAASFALNDETLSMQ